MATVRVSPQRESAFQTRVESDQGVFAATELLKLKERTEEGLRM